MGFWRDSILWNFIKSKLLRKVILCIMNLWIITKFVSFLLDIKRINVVKLIVIYEICYKNIREIDKND